MKLLEHLVMKARDAAASGIGALSTGEALAAALVLNRSDWLASMNYTVAEAIERIGPEWTQLIPAAAKAIGNADAVLRQTGKAANDAAVFAAGSNPDDVVDIVANLVTVGNAPGYRDVSLTFDVQRPKSSTSHRVCFRINPKDSERVARHIHETYRVAWNRGEPIDIQPGEQRPHWFD